MSGDVVVSVDAMGGDAAPGIVIEGAALSTIRHPEARFLFHGDEAALKPLLDAQDGLAKRSEIRHTADIVNMDDKPSAVLRSGRSTSMWRALESVEKGEAEVAISAGNTGALMAMAKLQLRTMPGITRPAIAAIWPSVRGESIVLDVGANVERDQKQLVDFAVMGEAFARAILGLPNPSVGLLNVGAEQLKGHEAIREADRILREAGLPMNYTGFIEGDDIGSGTVDVVVTDGFSGNVALKTAEGTARLIAHYMNSSIRASLFSRIGYLLAIGAFRTLRQRLDPRRVNGGVFLGLNGVVVKSHGGTDGTGFASALDLAVDLGRTHYAELIAQTTAQLNPRISAAMRNPGTVAEPAGETVIS